VRRRRRRRGVEAFFCSQKEEEMCERKQWSVYGGKRRKRTER